MLRRQMTIPVYVLTGFLGSGKTTLLNRLLARRAQRGATGRIAFIVNELGEVGIDGELLPAEATRQIELPGGCVCCVLNESLDATLLELADRDPSLEAIVLETTGVAEPLPIAWSLERAPLCERFRLAAVITLIDSENFVASRALSPAVDAQVGYADVLVLTKREQASDVPAARAAARLLAPDAPLLELSTDEAAAWLDHALADPTLPRIAHSGHEAHEHHEHDGHDHSAHGIDSVWVPIDGRVDLEELEDHLAALPANYVRIKGIAEVIDGRRGDDAPHWVAFHRVGLRVSSEVIPGPSVGRAVALGQDIDAAVLARCIAGATLT